MPRTSPYLPRATLRALSDILGGRFAFLTFLIPRPIASSRTLDISPCDGFPPVLWFMSIILAFLQRRETLCRHVAWGRLSESWPPHPPVSTMCRISTHVYHMLLYGGCVDRIHRKAYFDIHSLSFPFSLPLHKGIYTTHTGL